MCMSCTAGRGVTSASALGGGWGGGRGGGEVCNVYFAGLKGSGS